MTTFSYFARKCFGVRGQRLVRTLVLCAVVYGGLSAAGVQLADLKKKRQLLRGEKDDAVLRCGGGPALRRQLVVQQIADGYPQHLGDLVHGAHGGVFGLAGEDLVQCAQGNAGQPGDFLRGQMSQLFHIGQLFHHHRHRHTSGLVPTECGQMDPAGGQNHPLELTMGRKYSI